VNLDQWAELRHHCKSCSEAFATERECFEHYREKHTIFGKIRPNKTSAADSK
jgi:hypothetical protein